MTGSAIALGIAVGYILLRSGFPADFQMVARVVGFSLLLVNLPVPSERSWYWNAGSAAVACLAGVVVIGQLHSDSFAEAVGIAAAISGWLLFAVTLLRLRRIGMHRAHVWATVGLAVYYPLCYWGSGFAEALHEYSADSGAASLDSLFHSSLAQMIRTYDYPSTGLDGLLYSSYHFGVHWLAARLASLWGLDLWGFFNFASGVVFVPLLICSILRLVFRFAGRSGLGRGTSIFWFLAAAGQATVLHPAGSRWWGVYRDLIYSDSYVLATALLLVLVHASTIYFGNPPRISSNPSFALWCIFALALGFAAGLVKVSSLYVLLCAASYLAFRLGWWRRAIVVAAWIAAILTAVAWSRVSVHPIADDVWYRHLSRMFSVAGFVGFLVYCAFWVALYAFLRIRGTGESCLGLPSAAGGGRALGLEVLVACCLACMAPGLLVDLNRDQAYFVSVPALLAFAMVAAWILRHGLPSGPRALTAAVGAIIAANLAVGVFDSGRRLITKSLSARRALAGSPELRGNFAKRDFLVSSLSGRERLVRSERAAMLHRLAALPSREKRESAVFVPPSNVTYWNAHCPELSCGFVIPAFTGIAAIHGIPRVFSEEEKRGWGFWVYPDPVVGMRDDDALASALARARALGFKQLIVVDLLPSDECCVIQKRRL